MDKLKHNYTHPLDVTSLPDDLASALGSIKNGLASPAQTPDEDGTVTIQDLMRRFQTCSTEERVYVVVRAFHEETGIEYVTGRFYVRLARLAELRESDLSAYKDKAQKICKALREVEK